MPRRSSKKFTLHLIISIYLIFQLAINLRLLMYGASMYSCQIRYMNQRQFVIYITYFHAQNCNVTLLPIYKNVSVGNSTGNDTNMKARIDVTETTSELLFELSSTENAIEDEDYSQSDENDENEDIELEDFDELENYTEVTKNTGDHIPEISTSPSILNNTEESHQRTETVKRFFVKTQNATTANSKSTKMYSVNEAHAHPITVSAHHKHLKNISSKEISTYPNISHQLTALQIDDKEIESGGVDENEIDLPDLNVRLFLSNEQHMINVYLMVKTVKWPVQANAYPRTYGFIQTYFIFVSLCLILTFIFLFVVIFYGLKFDDPFCFYIVFILTVLLGILLLTDIIAVIIYAIDNDKTFNFVGWLKFVGVRHLTNEIIGYSNKIRRSFFTSPARWLTLLACRYVLLWFANAFIFSYFLYKIISVLFDEDYESTSDSDGTTATSGGYSLRSR